MKSVRLLSFVLVCFTTVGLTQEPAEPAAIGDLFHLDASQTLRALPAEQWEDVPKKIGFFAHGGFFLQISGNHSSYRIKVAQPEFVFKTGNPEAGTLYALSLKRTRGLRNIRNSSVSRDDSRFLVFQLRLLGTGIPLSN